MCTLNQIKINYKQQYLCRIKHLQRLAINPGKTHRMYLCPTELKDMTCDIYNMICMASAIVHFYEEMLYVSHENITLYRLTMREHAKLREVHDIM